MAATLTGAGYQVARWAGTDRYDTAVKVAGQLDTTTIVEASGTTFADALSGGAAAAHVHGPVLLTNGSTMPPSVQVYLNGRPGARRIAVGRPGGCR